MENEAEYDSIAQQYKDSKQLDFRKYIEEYSLFKIAGNIAGMKILDLACGEGIYSRKMESHGAAEIIGVDLSSAMIDLAKSAESKNCKYLVADVISLPSIGEFDLVVGMYLLNYSKSYSDLLAFCKAAAENLKSGCRFIGFNDNPWNSANDYSGYKKYGFIKVTTANRNEGDPVKYVIYNPDGSEFSFDNFYMSPDSYERAFAEAGFSDFKWEGPFLDPAENSNSYWDLFMQSPPLTGFSAMKI